MLEVSNLDLTVENTKVLKSISFKDDSQCLFILGPNGSGKTSLMKFLAGITELPRQESNIKHTSLFMPSHFQLHDGLRVKDIFEIFKVSTNLYSQYIELFEIKNLTHRFTNSLSSGELQRVLLISHLCYNSEYCLLDEPLNFLDQHYYHSLKSAVISLMKKKRFIISCHDLNWCLNIPGSNTLLLSKGIQTNYGPTTKVLISDELQKAFRIQTQVSDNTIDNSKILITAAYEEKRIRRTTD